MSNRTYFVYMCAVCATSPTSLLGMSSIIRIQNGNVLGAHSKAISKSPSFASDRAKIKFIDKIVWRLFLNVCFWMLIVWARLFSTVIHMRRVHDKSFGQFYDCALKPCHLSCLCVRMGTRTCICHLLMMVVEIELKTTGSTINLELIPNTLRNERKSPVLMFASNERSDVMNFSTKDFNRMLRWTRL